MGSEVFCKFSPKVHKIGDLKTIHSENVLTLKFRKTDWISALTLFFTILNNSYAFDEECFCFLNSKALKLERSSTVNDFLFVYNKFTSSLQEINSFSIHFSFSRSGLNACNVNKFTIFFFIDENHTDLFFFFQRRIPLRNWTFNWWRGLIDIRSFFLIFIFF